MDLRTLSELDHSIRVLRRSKLLKTPEFNDMLLASERFQRDAKLASLTRKDQNQLNQMFEDGQFFSILLGMLTEVARSSGLKQRDDLRKVYHWYQMNKDVLHCRPHFQSVSTPPNEKPPELNFSPEVIKLYSICSERRKRKQVEENSVRISTEDEDSVDGNIQEYSRPATAPPVLNRPKIENTLPSSNRKSYQGQQYFIEESGLSISYINKHLTPRKYMATLERPASALAAVRQYQQSLPNKTIEDDLSSDGRQSPSMSTNLSGSDSSMVEGRVVETIQCTDLRDTETVDINGRIESHTQNEKKYGLDEEAPSGAVNPVSQQSFVQDEIYGDGDPPDEKKYPFNKIQVTIPGESGDGASLASKTNLQKWQEFQQSSSSVVVNNKEGNFQSDGMIVEMPEFSTEQVIADFAVRSGPPTLKDSSHCNNVPSLEDFYKVSEKFSPSVNQKKLTMTKHPCSQSKLSAMTSKVATRNTLSHNSVSHSVVKLDSVVDLAGPISDQMVLERESQQEPMEPRLRNRLPTTVIPSPRSHTALGHSSKTHIFIPDGRTKSSPCSPRSSLGSQESPRSVQGDYDFPERSHYDVHFRRMARPLTAPMHMPHAVRNKPIRPDSIRYRWRDNGLGYPTYCKILRSKSASPKSSLRTAGSTSGGGRPRTALSNPEKSYYKPLRDTKIQVPGAASHSSSTIHPLTISAMMSVRYLGGTSFNFREDVHPSASNFWNNEDFLDDISPNLEFMSISHPAPVHETKSVDESCLKDGTIPEDDTINAKPLDGDRNNIYDSIEGQLRRARSENGAGDTDSQNGDSSERGLSPEPADLSDIENEMMELTTRDEDDELSETAGERNDDNNHCDEKSEVDVTGEEQQQVQNVSYEYSCSNDSQS